jgi:hypothetical protein
MRLHCNDPQLHPLWVPQLLNHAGAPRLAKGRFIDGRSMSAIGGRTGKGGGAHRSGSQVKVTMCGGLTQASRGRAMLSSGIDVVEQSADAAELWRRVLLLGLRLLLLLLLLSTLSLDLVAAREAKNPKGAMVS